MCEVTVKALTETNLRMENRKDPEIIEVESFAASLGINALLTYRVKNHTAQKNVTNSFLILSESNFCLIFKHNYEIYQWNKIKSLSFSNEILKISFANSPDYVFEADQINLLVSELCELLQRILLPSELKKINFNKLIAFPVGPGTMSPIVRYNMNQKQKIEKETYNKFKFANDYGAPTIDLQNIRDIDKFMPILLDTIPLFRYIKILRIPLINGEGIFPKITELVHNLTYLCALEIAGSSKNQIETFVQNVQDNKNRSMLSALSFCLSELKKEDLNKISELIVSGPIRAIEFHKALYYKANKYFYSTFLSPALNNTLRILNLDRTIGVDLQKLFPRIRNIPFLSLANCNLDIGETLNILSDCKMVNLSVLNLSGNEAKSIPKNDIEIPEMLRKLVLNDISWPENYLAEFYQFLFDKFVNGLYLSFSGAVASTEEFFNLFNFLKTSDYDKLLGFAWNNNPVHLDLFNFLLHNPQIRHLSFDGCFNEDCPEMVLALSAFVRLAPLLKTLSIEGNKSNHLGTQMTEIVKAVTGHKSLKIVNIPYSYGGDEVLLYISKIPSKETSIKILNFEGVNATSPNDFFSTMRFYAKFLDQFYISYPLWDFENFSEYKKEIKEIKNMYKLAFQDKGTFIDYKVKQAKVSLINPRHFIYRYYPGPLEVPFPSYISENELTEVLDDLTIVNITITTAPTSPKPPSPGKSPLNTTKNLNMNTSVKSPPRVLEKPQIVKREVKINPPKREINKNKNQIFVQPQEQNSKHDQPSHGSSVPDSEDVYTYKSYYSYEEITSTSSSSREKKMKNEKHIKKMKKLGDKKGSSPTSNKKNEKSPRSPPKLLHDYSSDSFSKSNSDSESLRSGKFILQKIPTISDATTSKTDSMKASKQIFLSQSSDSDKAHSFSSRTFDDKHSKKVPSIVDFPISSSSDEKLNSNISDYNLQDMIKNKNIDSADLMNSSTESSKSRNSQKSKSSNHSNNSRNSKSRQSREDSQKSVSASRKSIPRIHESSDDESFQFTIPQSPTTQENKSLASIKSDSKSDHSSKYSLSSGRSSSSHKRTDEQPLADSEQPIIINTQKVLRNDLSSSSKHSIDSAKSSPIKQQHEMVFYGSSRKARSAQLSLSNSDNDEPRNTKPQSIFAPNQQDIQKRESSVSNSSEHSINSAKSSPVKEQHEIIFGGNPWKAKSVQLSLSNSDNDEPHDVILKTSPIGNNNNIQPKQKSFNSISSENSVKSAKSTPPNMANSFQHNILQNSHKAKSVHEKHIVGPFSISENSINADKESLVQLAVLSIPSSTSESSSSQRKSKSNKSLSAGLNLPPNQSVKSSHSQELSETSSSDDDNGTAFGKLGAAFNLQSESEEEIEESGAEIGILHPPSNVASSNIFKKGSEDETDDYTPKTPKFTNHELVFPARKTVPEVKERSVPIQKSTDESSTTSSSKKIYSPARKSEYIYIQSPIQPRTRGSPPESPGSNRFPGLSGSRLSHGKTTSFRSSPSTPKRAPPLLDYSEPEWRFPELIDMSPDMTLFKEIDKKFTLDELFTNLSNEKHFSSTRKLYQ